MYAAETEGVCARRARHSCEKKSPFLEAGSNYVRKEFRFSAFYVL